MLLNVVALKYDVIGKLAYHNIQEYPIIKRTKATYPITHY